MAIKIEEQFRIEAPADRVFEYLLTVEEVVECIPGATLLEKQDDRTFVGEVRVSVGPVKVAYKGKASFTEVDEASRTVRMKGQGQEKSGGGSASMTMTSRVAELDDGGAEVRVEVDLDVVGKLVQFGRGMIQEISRQLFNQFADCVRSTLSAEAGGPPEGAEGGAAAVGAGEADGGGGQAGAAGKAAGDGDRNGATGDAAGRGGATAATAATGGPDGEPPEPGAGASVAASADDESPTGTGATATPPPHQGGGEPVKILPILWRALRNRIARLFGRG